MFKKLLLITLFVLFAGVLVAGGAYRTTAKTANETRLSAERSELAHLEGSQQGLGAADHEGEGGERQGQGLGNGGTGQGRNQKAESEQGGLPSNVQGGQGQAQGNSGQGQAQGNSSQGRGQGGGRSANEEALEGEGYQGGQGRGQKAERAGEVYEEHESITVEGTISQAPANGVDMVIETADGEVKVGTGPGYLQEMGFELNQGDLVQVSGFWEEGEFKAETITRDGEMIALRDEFGRPMWSGAARNGSGQGNGGGGRERQELNDQVSS